MQEAERENRQGFRPALLCDDRHHGSTVEIKDERACSVGINSESEIAANLQIGPTSEGMVRLYVTGEGVDLPFDFDPEEAEEIAEEIRAAAGRARSMAK